MPRLAQFLIGLLFGLGLVIAGMSNPQKVLNFLDLASIAQGGWDPSLAFVMAGGVIVSFIGYRFVLKQQRPLFDKQFHLPRKTTIDLPVLVGPAIFGIGWGLAGFCPGPAYTALGTGSGQAALLVIAMTAGMIIARVLAVSRIAATAS